MKTVECKNCGKLVIKSNTRYNESIKQGWNFYCSLVCRYGYQEKGRSFSCAQCHKTVSKTPAELRKTKHNIFCSKSCAAVYNNCHKRYGIRRSRIEQYLELCLKQEFGDLVIRCNTTDAINAELDFYFPSLQLAIEVNGIFHYQPIHGEKKLKRIQGRDQQKAAECQQRGIELYTLDVSQEAYFNQEAKEKYWKLVKGLVTSAKRRAGHTNVQVP